MKRTFVAILVSLITVSAFLVNFLPLGRGNPSPVLVNDQLVTSPSLLLKRVSTPREESAEAVPCFAQGVTGEVIQVAATTPATQITPAAHPILAQLQQPAPAPLPPPATVAPVQYVYFYTGVPVHPAPAAGSFVPVVSMPTVQSYTVPIFVPQVVPNRAGAPKWVYSNGVVIKPKVYYPRQPLRNSIRGVTP